MPTYLAGPANKQGRIVADNIIFGNQSKYKGAIGTAIVKLFDLTIATSGVASKHLKIAQVPHIVSTSTKASEGHDEDISAEEIIKTGLASETDWNILKDYTLKLFARGKEIAAKQGQALGEQADVFHGNFSCGRSIVGEKEREGENQGELLHSRVQGFSSDEAGRRYMRARMVRENCLTPQR